MRTTRALPFLLLLPLAAPACHTYPKMGFMHWAQRGQYLVQDDEIMEFRFFLSDRVLAQNVELRETGSTQADRVVIADPGTAGTVLEVGPYWIRVTFTEGSTGVYFVTNLDKEDDLYWLGTELPGEEGYHIVRDQKKKVLWHEGAAYDIVQGVYAHLQMDFRAWSAIQDERRIIKGTPEPKPEN